MDASSLVTGIAIGAAVGAVIGHLVTRLRSQSEVATAGAEAAAQQSRAEAAIAERAKVDAALADADGRISAAQASESAAKALAATSRAELEAERRAAGEKLVLLERAETKLREAFSALSADALRVNNEAFVALAQAKLGQFQDGARTDLEARTKAIEEMLKPVRESLGKVDTTLQGIEKERAQSYGALAQHLTSLGSAQLELQGETRRLVKALSAPQVRGAWGEIQLRRVVEMAGMLDHCDFHEQVASADGRFRPDLVVRLPGGKNVVVDSKAPLAAYLEAMDAPDDASRALRLADHTRQVRTHMADLASKAYWSQLDATPEFVVMFLPGEAVFSAALQNDPSLIEFGVVQRVLPASPVTLITLLRAVAYGWSQEKIAEGAQRISDHAQELCDRIGILTEKFQKVGRGLESAVAAYNESVGSLETRVLVSARRFRELGVPAAKEIREIEPVERTVRLPAGSETPA